MYKKIDSIFQTIIFLLFVILFSTGYCQPGLKMAEPLVEYQNVDTTSFSFPNPVLPLRNWQLLSDNQYVEIEKESPGLNVYDYISPDYMPRNPFEVDLRTTSNYVPREVRDELNLIMNRPRDSAFLPILPVAFLAMQLASQHLLISKKTEITVQNVEDSKMALPVLEILWKESPQTITQLYENPVISPKHTMRYLESLIQVLIDNKLVKTRKIENAQTKYFYAIDQRHYDDIISRAEASKKDLSKQVKSEHSRGLK